MTSQYGLYAYGLIGAAPGQLYIAGIDKKNNVYAVEGYGLHVIVSAIEIEAFQSLVKQSFAELTQTAAANATEALLQAHEDVVEALMQQTTVVPFKFGSILKDEEAALRMLRDDEERFKQLLARFTGKAEWGLKVYADTQEFTQHIAQAEPSFKDLRAQGEQSSRGAAYLLRKKLEAGLEDTVAARLASVSEAIFQQLGSDAYEATLNKTLPQKLTGKKQAMILNGAYLVEKAGIDRFLSLAKSLQERYTGMGLELEVSGPWPPYSFTGHPGLSS